MLDFAFSLRVRTSELLTLANEYLITDFTFGRGNG